MIAIAVREVRKMDNSGAEIQQELDAYLKALRLYRRGETKSDDLKEARLRYEETVTAYKWRGE